MKTNISNAVSKINDIDQAIDIVNSYVLNDVSCGFVIELLQEYRDKILNIEINM